MGLRVNTNIASMTAQRNLQTVTSRLQGNFSRLSSGLRIATSADDAAGLAISERMRSQIRSYAVAARNAQDGISLAQTAESALNESSDILVRMRELAMQSANGTLSTADRATVDVEFGQLIEELDRVSTTASFNGIALLDGTMVAGIDIQVGISSGATEVISISGVDATTGAGGLNVATLDVTSVANANTALGQLDSAIDSLNTSRGELGAAQNRIQSSLRGILSAKENLSAAESRIRDVDIAAETADLTRNTIMQQAATSVLQQANVQPQIALQLLQG